MKPGYSVIVDYVRTPFARASTPGTGKKRAHRNIQTSHRSTSILVLIHAEPSRFYGVPALSAAYTAFQPSPRGRFVHRKLNPGSCFKGTPSPRLGCRHPPQSGPN